MIAFNLERIKKELPSGVKLVAVSKFHPFEAILEAYNEGQRAFGENRPQEFALKAVQLPAVGEDYTREDQERDSERISQLLRVMTAVSFKLNLGSTNLRKDHDRVSDWVFDKDPDLKAFDEGTVKLDREDWEKSLDMWYEAMGWNKETGIPTRETLEKFDLKDCADKLEELGLI